MLHIKHPKSCISERKYIFTVLLEEFLGLQFDAEQIDTNIVSISFESKTLQINDDFFSIAQKTWLSKKSLPLQPLKIWDSSHHSRLDTKISSSKIPVIYGEPSVSINENLCYLGIDIFGSAFFMLSRYEETIKNDRDRHDRFPATASLAFQEGFLERPIINEYVEILWACMKRLWPGLKRKTKQFKIIPTHDVDMPYCIAGRSIKDISKFVAAETIRRKQYKKALHCLAKIPQIKAGNVDLDPFNTFDWLMKKNEENNLKSTFFFFTHKRKEFVHGNYTLSDSRLKSLILNIHNRGHEVGLHGSLNSYTDSDMAVAEANALLGFCRKEKINQGQWGVRQHFLQWHTSESFIMWQKAGMDYDSTLGFADMPGFRCGTCYDFPAYDLRGRSQLIIREQPLIAMESSILSKKYRGIGNNDQSIGLFNKLKEICKQFNGQFVLLWHNSSLWDNKEKELYEQIIRT